MAIIAIDSSGVVGQPPIYFIAARIKYRRGRIDHKSQRHLKIMVGNELHDSFINKAQGWRLKLSAALIYYVMICLLHHEDKIVIDVDFDPSNRIIVKRYIDKLLFTYHRETPIQHCPFEFKSIREDECVRIVDFKTKKARREYIHPNERVKESILNEFFDVLKKIR
ncbi:MAG TPA: hypothetical protein VJ729_05450 [Nitrososphaeraceae archaeon]|nr:hypothetical protein [Nitrososphaeraceae archaeon]